MRPMPCLRCDCPGHICGADSSSLRRPRSEKQPMKKSEARALVATLAAAFPRQQVPQVTFDVYTGDLADLDFGVTEKAPTNLRRSSRWFPTMAEIREAVAELQLDAPGPMEAYAQAVHGEKGDRHPLVQKSK